jgi:nucleotide-binding universal stress UspA family protein
MVKCILVPVDFSASSLKALEYAVELGRSSRAEMVLFHAVEPVYFAATGGIYGAGFDASLVYRELENAARERLAALARKLTARRLRVRTLLAVGAAHRSIADAARSVKADLIVMSTHGRTGVAHALMGSVAERVVRTAPCPVLTVPARRAAVRRRGRKVADVPARRAAGRS